MSAPTEDPKAKAVFAKLERVATEMDRKDAARFAQLRARLEKSRDTYYVTEIALPNVAGVAKLASYGDIVYRAWTADEVMAIQADLNYQKANRTEIRTTPDGTQVLAPPPPLNLEEAKALFSLYNEYIAKAFPPDSGLTAKDLDAMSNWSWTRFVFYVIAARSGMDASFDKDLTDFFRDRLG